MPPPLEATFVGRPVVPGQEHPLQRVLNKTARGERAKATSAQAAFQAAKGAGVALSNDVKAAESAAVDARARHAAAVATHSRLLHTAERGDEDLVRAAVEVVNAQAVRSKELLAEASEAHTLCTRAQGAQQRAEAKHAAAKRALEDAGADVTALERQAKAAAEIGASLRAAAATAQSVCARAKQQGDDDKEVSCMVADMQRLSEKVQATARTRQAAVETARKAAAAAPSSGGEAAARKRLVDARAAAEAAEKQAKECKARWLEVSGVAGKVSVQAAALLADVKRAEKDTTARADLRMQLVAQALDAATRVAEDAAAVGTAEAAAAEAQRLLREGKARCSRLQSAADLQRVRAERAEREAQASGRGE